MYLIKILKNPIVKAIGILALTILLLTMTNPNTVVSVVLVGPFVLLFGILYYLVLIVLGQRGGKGILSRWRPSPIAALVASFPTLLLVLQSIGQLTMRDIVTSGILYVIAYFYATKLSVGNMPEG